MGERVAGRWRRHAAQVRSDKATARMTPDERVKLEAAAARVGLRLGGYLVEAGLRLADETNPAPPSLVASAAVGRDRAMLGAWEEANRLLRQYGNNVNQAVALWHRTHGGAMPAGLIDAVQLTNGVARRVDGLVDEHRRRR
jgi:hypothetical protein